MREVSQDQGAYPKVMVESHFKQWEDTRDSKHLLYVIETVVINREEERDFYEGLDHEANIVLTTRLSGEVAV
tara:strand:- start:124 stop:339 length:216 start_codon:yes stop_codon:yes gene_type:complete